ncbi:putative bifunctional diguanylate cyclase/phosphodiesterase [Aquibium microcysteis]|uniref:putative bifunctional diguanylate cyclase/phosphodiesterase n=1 Tax=Aquibium microcysteis TaxID=675281 RepID=UPI00165D2A9F|nr:EAL domain-containing protein [Aquibium microcysteis]
MRTAALGIARPEETSEAGLTDLLTGLGNSRRFLAKIRRLIADRASDPAPFVVGIVDLDGFKPVNDLFGMASGDEILCQAAMRLRAALDPRCTIVRLGADEFGFLLPLTFSEAAAGEQARILIEVLSAPYDLGERSARLSASVGCALYFTAAEGAEDLIRKAETALYDAKRAGRGRVVVYSQEIEDKARRVTLIEQALRRAVAAGEVEPWFQPIVCLSSRRVLGCEALARWTDRDLGVVSPGEFIPIAEERGIIGQLSQVLLRKAALAAADWPEEVYLSFNLSPSQLVDQNTSDHVLSILAETGLPPGRLQIEITETGMMCEPASAERIVEDLRSAGIRTALDDFGTGQSSLGRLRQLHFDTIKIDQSFVAAMLTDPPTQHIVRAILAMCDGLEKDVVAEGIECEEQAARLAFFGCQKGQGYFFGRPMRAEATAAHVHGYAASARPAGT